MFTCYISYRRNRPWQARSLHTELKRHNYKSILDVGNILVGTRFPQAVEHDIRKSQVVFVVIDKEWVEEKDGQRPLNNPEDWVRREIELALELEIPIIPLLVENAKMPQQEDLPESLQALTEFQGVQLRNDNFDADLDCIVQELEARAKLQVEAQRVLESAREHWDKGNWLQIHKRLIEARTSWGKDQGGRLMPHDVARRLAVSSQLMQAAEAFKQRKFDAALDVLAQVPIEEAPRNVAYSMRLAKIGRRTLAASKLQRIDALKDAAEEYALVKNEAIVDQVEIVPGLDEVGKVISEAQCGSPTSGSRTRLRPKPKH
jgi:predicted GNAT family N-acyltransferase